MPCQCTGHCAGSAGGIRSNCNRIGNQGTRTYARVTNGQRETVELCESCGQDAESFGQWCLSDSLAADAEPWYFTYFAEPTPNNMPRTNVCECAGRCHNPASGMPCRASAGRRVIILSSGRAASVCFECANRGVNRNLFAVCNPNSSEPIVAPQTPMPIVTYESILGDAKMRIPDRAFGVEFEIQPPRASEHIDRNDQMHQTAELLSANGIVTRSRGYTHDVVSYWKIVTDGSVSGGYELVSPILKGLEGLAQVEKVCQTLTSAGYRVDRSCGLHVHVDARDFDRKALIRLVRQFLIEEHNFDKFVTSNRLENDYCMSNIARFGNHGTRLQTLKYAHQNLGNEAQTIYRQIATSRYYKLNLDALWRQHTVEFRMHQGTIDATTAIRWIRACVMFTCGALNVNNDSAESVDKLYFETAPDETLKRFEKLAYRRGRKRAMQGGVFDPPPVAFRRERPLARPISIRRRGRPIPYTAWDTLIAYQRGEVVSQGADVFVAEENNTGQCPPYNPTAWRPLRCTASGQYLSQCRCTRHVQRRERLSRSGYPTRPDITAREVV